MRSYIVERSYGSVKVFYIDRERLINDLKKWAEKVSKLFNVSEIILFGSIAKGNATPGSDADVLIVVERGNKEKVWKKAYSLWSGFPMDLFVVKKGEENTIVDEADRYGMTLYEKEIPE